MREDGRSPIQRTPLQPWQRLCLHLWLGVRGVWGQKGEELSWGMNSAAAQGNVSYGDSTSLIWSALPIFHESCSVPRSPAPGLSPSLRLLSACTCPAAGEIGSQDPQQPALPGDT
ncbi:hypothetical protein Y1Q_0004493 [Alligator mississippiensis]|uniref:Uncharacterized protein n=1 Tax=Alligator mississippiensis TaxID=8496 RepID=A0A151NY45_ALLMI|nr:hypothetical protein Y1Q_0004493 [Alligator mississippiensis]